MARQPPGDKADRTFCEKQHEEAEKLELPQITVNKFLRRIGTKDADIEGHYETKYNKENGSANMDTDKDDRHKARYATGSRI